MTKALTRKGCKLCVLCKQWNGAIGSTTIEPKLGGQFLYDHSEKETCFKKCIQTNAWGTCQYFELRY